MESMGSYRNKKLFTLILVCSCVISVCQNDSTSDLARIEGYWCVDSVSQFVNGQLFETNVMDEDNCRFLRSMYLINNSSNVITCPKIIYVIAEEESDIKIIRKEFAVVENDTMRRGERCGEYEYAQSWFLGNDGHLEISSETEQGVKWIHYYSQKKGEKERNIRLKIEGLQEE